MANTSSSGCFYDPSDPKWKKRVGPTQFKNPANGFVEDFTPGGAFFGTLLFGPLYFALKGIWSHFIASIILAIATAGISWIIYPFCASRIVERSYLKRGWIAVDHENSKSLSEIKYRECPYCAELIKAKAIKCKHCGSEIEPNTI